MSKLQSVSRSKTAAVQKLLQKKYRSESKKFLVEGARNVEEALASDWAVSMLLVTPDFLSRQARPELLNHPGLNGIPSYQISEREFKKISETVHPQGVIAVVEKKLYGLDFLNSLGERSVVVALDEVTEPGNMGTLIRTCDWFGVDALLIGKESVDVFNPKVVRGAMGSIFHVPFVSDINLGPELKRLKAKGFRVYVATAQEGGSIEKTKWEKKMVIVLGNEARGVSVDVKRIADDRLTIPRFGRAESLNVGIACGIILGFIRTYADSTS